MQELVGDPAVVVVAQFLVGEQRAVGLELLAEFQLRGRIVFLRAVGAVGPADLRETL